MDRRARTGAIWVKLRQYQEREEMRRLLVLALLTTLALATMLAAPAFAADPTIVEVCP